MNKEVLIVITKGEMGGAQEVVRQLARGLYKKGHHITVGYGQGEYLAQELKPLGIKTIQFQYLKRGRNPFTNMLFGYEIKKLLDTHPFEILHIHSSNALFAAWGAKQSNHPPKTIFTFHGLSFLDPAHGNKIVRALYRFAFKYLLRYIDTSVFVCERDMRIAQKIGIGKKRTVIYNGIETPNPLPLVQARNMLSEKIGSNINKKIIIGSIGRLAYPKNYEMLIQTVGHLATQKSDTVYIIIGEGPERKKYESIIRQHALQNVFFLPGEISHAASLLGAFDVFTLTSLYEGMPMTLIEALYAGTAILAPNVGGISEMLTNDSFQVYDQKNEREFRTKLSILIRDAHTREMLGNQNKKRSALFSADRMTDAYEKIITS